MNIDVESLISAIDQHYNSNNRISSTSSTVWYINPRPFFTIGINYAYFIHPNLLSKDNNGNLINLWNLYYASEKIGFKIKFFDTKYTRSFEPGEFYKYKGSYYRWLRPQKETTISDFNLIVYASGLLYNIVNLKSNSNFDYAISGASLGLTFFNGLSTNLGIACPFTSSEFKMKNAFLNAGVDIPIIDYITALTKKN